MNQTMIQWAIDLLCIVYKETKPEEIARLSIGERDARLLLLRGWLFGSRLQNMTECPVCSERIEWENDIQDIRLQLPNPEAIPGEFLLEEEGYSIRFRLPDSNDLSDIVDGDTSITTPEKLLEKLILDCKYKAESLPFEKLPVNILASLDQRIEEKDQQADIIMKVTCVKCNHQWEVQFDIANYLWNEINSWARHVLQDIGALARTYGWSEHDILNMSPARRKIYLDMAYS